MSQKRDRYRWVNPSGLDLLRLGERGKILMLGKIRMGEVDAKSLHTIIWRGQSRFGYSPSVDAAMTALKAAVK